MSRKKKTGAKPIHTNVLVNSKVDSVTLCAAVEERFKTLLDSWLRIKGEQIAPPSYLDKDMLLWRTVSMRFKDGDYRNTRDEELATRRIADWTHLKNCELRNQKHRPLEWVD